MNAESIIKSLRVLWCADRIVAEIQLRRLAFCLTKLRRRPKAWL
jgi:hypothetical protein